MTRDELKSRKAELETKIMKLEDQLLDCDVNSASMSAGGGSKSYTNRTVADLKAKLAYARRRLAKISAALGERADPGAVEIIPVEYGS